MRVLLDECVPRPLRRQLPEHEIKTVAEMGWAGKQNGELLALVNESGFAAFITVDQSLPYEQNLRDSGIAVIILSARSNDIDDLSALVPAPRRTLESLTPGSLTRIDQP